MSKNIKTHVLTQAEVNKKILSITGTKERSERSQWRDYFGNPQHENLKEYKEKKEQFLAAAKAYKKLNIKAMTGKKLGLHRDYEESLNLDFLKETKHGEQEECEPFCVCKKCEPNKTGGLIRKRSLREMPDKEECSDLDVGIVEITEPWFKRFLTLNKFIWAARTVVIHNRLMKVLEKLKLLTVEDINKIEDTEVEKKCEDYHCHPVFLKFL